MQVRGQAGATDFHRAVNEHDLGSLGDPERWGGTVAFDYVLNSGRFRSEQFIRVQTPGLEARAWDLICFWQVGPGWVAATDTLNVFGLEVQFGGGQSSGFGFIPVGQTVRNQSGLFRSESIQLSPNSLVVGTDQMEHPIPAATINIRATADFARLPVPLTPTILHCELTVVVAPRALQ